MTNPTLRATKRKRIDAAFARMADDPAYCAELLCVETAFTGGSDAAWRTLDATEGQAQSEGNRKGAGFRDGESRNAM